MQGRPPHVGPRSVTTLMWVLKQLPLFQKVTVLLSFLKWVFKSANFCCKASGWEWFQSSQRPPISSPLSTELSLCPGLNREFFKNNIMKYTRVIGWVSSTWGGCDFLCFITRFNNPSLSLDPAEQLLSYESVFRRTQSQSLLQQVCPGNVMHTLTTRMRHFIVYLLIHLWLVNFCLNPLDGANGPETCRSGEQQESGPGKKGGTYRWPAQSRFSIHKLSLDGECMKGQLSNVQPVIISGSYRVYNYTSKLNAVHAVFP